MAKSTPWLALGILTLINLFNYLDRSIAPAIMPAIQKDLSLSDTQVGLLGTCFILVYFVISPLFGWLGDRANRNRLMAAGVGVWSLATGLAGFVANYSQLVFARSAVGVGEAAYGSISPALIGDLFPKEKRGRVFAIFFMAMPVGVALGYLLGGILEAKYGWRHAFFFAGFPGIILAIALWWLPEPKRGAFDTEATAALLPVKQVYAALARNRAYVFTVLGYAAYTFVVGAVMVWVPTYLVRFLSVSLEKGNTVFGGITVVTGFLATFIGGIWGDRWAKKNADAYLLLSALSMFLAAPAFALLLMQTDFVYFSIVLFVVEFLVFLSTSPINAQIVNCVNPAYRATANAVSIFAIHLLGDALSPTLIGIISDQSNLRSALMLCPFVFLLAGLLWSMKSAFEFSVLPWHKSGACHYCKPIEAIVQKAFKRIL
jgi:MFS family permease